MKKLVVFVLLIALSTILVTSCRSDTESNLNDADSHGVADSESGSIVYDVNLGDDVNIIGLPTGEYAYVRSEIQIDNINMISTITVLDGIIYGVAEIWDDDMVPDYIQFFSIDLESDEIYLYPNNLALMEGHHSVLAITANATGDIFFVSQNFVWNNEVQTIDSFLTLAQIDRAGNLVFYTEISEYFEQNSMVNSIALDDRGNLYVQAENGDIVVFGSVGNYRFTVSRPGAVWSLPKGAPIQKLDGSMLFPYMTPDEGDILFTLDYETQSLLLQQALPEAQIYVSGLHDNELLLVSNAGVYSYFIDTGDQTHRFHWLDVGVLFSGDSIFPVNESQFALLDWGGRGRPTSVTILTRTAITDGGRTVVTLASIYPNHPLIHEFNRQSIQYQIVLLDYSDPDISTAIMRLNIDLIAGNIPDIIDLAGLNYQAIASAGFLSDLNLKFERDSQLSRSDFLARVFELIEVNSNLYAVTPAFFVSTAFAPASLVGSNPGITLERLMMLDNQFNDGGSLLHGATPQGFLEMYRIVNHSTLIDFDAGTAHFDTDAFIQVLEYANRLEQGEFLIERSFEEDVRRGNHHIRLFFINNLSELHTMEMASGTEVTAIGFPTAEKAGSIMIPTMLYGIGQGAQNPSGAWEFIRFMLGEQQQREMSIEAIPVSRVVFDDIIHELMNPVLIDSPELAGGLWVDGVFVDFAPMTQSQANRITEMINTLGAMLSGGEEVITYIITEEANGFFSGNRSAEDAARVIQSRVQTYVWERQR